jgi:hypothetical protein
VQDRRVGRRNALAAATESPLPGLLPDFTADAVAPTSPGMPPVDLDLTDVPEGRGPAASVQPLRGRRTRPTPPTAVDAADDDRPFGSSNADWA